MPTRSLSTSDYVTIVKKRLRGQSQEQVAGKMGVSVSLIRKIEQSNLQYQQIKRDLLASIVAETGRHMAEPQRPKIDNHKLVTLELMLTGCQQRIELIKDELLSDLSNEGLGSEKKLQSAVVHLRRIVDQAETLKANALGMFKTDG